MSYNYNLQIQESKSKSFWQNLKEFWSYLKYEKLLLIIAFIVVILNSLAGVVTPYIIALTIDEHLSKGDFQGIIENIIWLGIIYLVTAISGLLQSRIMGHISQNTLLKIRGTLFTKIQTLPLAFFNQNKAGDLMSRLNNDTDKINQLLSESVIRFVGNFFVIVGIAVFIFFLNFKLAIISLLSTIFIYLITRFLSPVVKNLNSQSYAATAEFEASVQENLSNFKVIAAFNQREYFFNHLQKNNELIFERSFKSDFISNLFRPVYDFAGYIAQLLVLVSGLYFISQGELTVGFLIGFISYTQRFYDPLRILGSIWTNIQSSLAAWGRIDQIMVLESDLKLQNK